jgi:ssDNA-binding replication factor A large subunit
VEGAKGKIKIKDLREGMLHVTIEVRVVGLIELATVKGKRLARYLVEDDTGRIELVLWDRAPINVGGRVLLKNAFVSRDYEGRLRLNVGKFGDIKALERPQ